MEMISWILEDIDWAATVCALSADISFLLFEDGTTRSIVDVTEVLVNKPENNKYHIHIMLLVYY